MNFAEEERKRAEFSQLLKELAMAENPTIEKRIEHFKKLEALYHIPGEKNHFRHFYSDIFSVLLEIKENAPNSGSFEYLTLNLRKLRENYRPNKNQDADGNSIDIQSAIRKLYDHVNLEISRIQYSDLEDYKISQAQAIQQLEQKASQAERLIKDAKRQAEESEKKAENAQKEYIAILGIFASIVLAFTGGMVFSSSVLEHMHTVSIYRILIVSLVLGVVLFNVVYLLVWCINKIVRDQHELDVRLWRAVHGVLILLMAGVIAAWFFGAVEARDANILALLQIK